MSSIDNLQNVQQPINITDPNIEKQSRANAPAINITDNNILKGDVKKEGIHLGDIMDPDAIKKRQDAFASIDVSNAPTLSNGSKLIDPSMIPSIKTEDDADKTTMEDKAMMSLHDAITIKKAEAEEELKAFIEETKVNEKIAAEKGITFDQNGKAITQDGEEASLTEEEDLEAALDIDIAKSKGLANLDNIPAANMEDPNHELEEVDEDEYNAIMNSIPEISAPVKEEETVEEEKEEMGNNEELEASQVNVEEPIEEAVEEEVESAPVEAAAKPELTETEKGRVIKFNPNSIPLEDELIKDVDEDTSDLNAEDEEKELEEFKDNLTTALGIAPKRIDISNFKIGAPVSATSVLSSMTSGNAVDSSDWALSNTKVPITIRKFTGIELKTLAAYNSNRRNRANTITERYRMIYDHDMNPYKPDTLEEWAKTISDRDDDDIFFGVYDATFHNSNHIPYACEDPKCGHSWISEHIPTSEMIKFETEEFEKEFMAIREQGPSKLSKRLARTRIIPITDKIAIAFRDASIYDVNFVYRLVGQEFYEKYSDTMDLMAYIDDIYNIDQKTGQLQPIACKKDKADMLKNIKNTVIIYNRILTTLTPDEYNLIVAASAKEAETDNKKKVKYVIPAAICPKCGKPIKEVSLDGIGGNPSMESQLFTRQPLGLMVNI